MNKNDLIEFFAIILIVIATVVASWGFTAFVIWLITLCFGFPYSSKVATGIWLVLYLAKTIFNVTAKSK